MFSERLVESAAKAAKYDGVLPDTMMEGLEILLADLYKNVDINERSRKIAEDAVGRALYNRMNVEKYIVEHSSLTSSPITEPTIIFGLPRTASTLVVNLLAADPNRRSLLKWESLNTVPPASSGTLFSDPRCVGMRQQQESFLNSNPEAGRMHWEFADEPTECDVLHAQDFKALRWAQMLPAPTYVEWIRSCDMSSAYDYHQTVLQILQSQAPGTWNLKCPLHGLYLHQVITRYPDARLIWTHRDPARAVASACSLAAYLQRSFLGQVPDLGAIGKNVLSLLTELVSKSMDVAQNLPEENLYHIHFENLTHDPIGEMRKLYRWLGNPLSDEVEERMRQRVATSRDGAPGRHTYNLEDYGLSSGMLRASFAEYIDHFEIAGSLAE